MGPGKTFWPAGVAQAITVEAFQQAFATLGYSVCHGPEQESGFEKIALFANAQGAVKHAARQQPSGRWSSKLGKMEDIEHGLAHLEDSIYGSVVLIMKGPVAEAME